MIDDLERTNFLLEKLKTVVPIEARLSQSLIRLLAEKSPEMPIPGRCNVIDVFYTGDEGGIICCLDVERLTNPGRQSSLNNPPRILS